MMEGASRAVSRSEAVVVEIRNRILNGAFEPGFHLQEIPLAKALGVSRTPIREALGILSKEGLLEPGPKRGYKIRTFTLKEVMDAYDVRADLEGLAARILAERGLTSDEATSIEDCLKLGDDLLKKGLNERDQPAWLEMNNTFHTILVRATDNAMLVNFVEQSHRVPLASSRHVHWYSLDKSTFTIARRAHDAHHDIYRAIRSRQSVSAEALMREHIYFSKRLISEHVGEAFLGFDSPHRPVQSGDASSRKALTSAT
ncbi:MAG: GntR family transcriptional regulator [Pseudorhodoplanes sp.]|uniref:GntR family transcriptional regulator n=1 Tax=Pseudorhodoplanes sp. TaxID=1934341 RepID=UPI003D131FA7